VSVICPRECLNRWTDHCVGKVVAGKAKCFYCGRFMPLDEAIEFGGEA